MQVAYSALKEPPRVVKAKRLSPNEERALKRLKIREARDVEKAIAEHPKEIKEIRKYKPGWMPEIRVK
jgi:hypothetical protein